jgi:hypothetical protein
MPRLPAIIEVLAIAGLLCMALFLRIHRWEFETVEHFDEGIYSSVLWYDALFEAPWGLPFLIDLFSLVPGVGDRAPFVPSLILGVLSPMLFWWVARIWFGRVAAIFVLAVTACSEFHVIYSRMALTDVPALSLVVASVGVGSLGMQRQSRLLSLGAGVLCGLAWWLKYTGWLPLAILWSGSIAWWLAEGRRYVSWRGLVLQLCFATGAAVFVFLPCWWLLQASGGYSAVAGNHAAYLVDWREWPERLGQQLAWQMLMDGVWGAGSLAGGFVLAAILATPGQRRFTWNIGSSGGEIPEASAGAGVRLAFWLRSATAALFLGFLSLRVHTPIMLGCLAIGGLAGMFLWPVLRRREGAVLESDMRGRRRGLMSCSPGEAHGPGFWMTTAWCAGLLAATPFYQSFSRLMLPLAAGVWLAAAGGVAWWLECQLVLFLVPRQLQRRRRFLETASRLVVTGLLVFALAAAMFEPDGNGALAAVSLEQLAGSSVFEDRRDIIRAAHEVVDRCGASVREDAGHSVQLNAGAVFTADLLLKLRSTGVEELSPLSPEERRRLRVVLCVYGEPALVWHLQDEGIAAAPVSHLNVTERGDGTPVFLVFGPNAKRTPGFWEQWMVEESRFEWIGDVLYRPGSVTLMDLCSPQYLATHEEARQQRLEVYRVR